MGLRWCCYCWEIFLIVSVLVVVEVLRVGFVVEGECECLGI